MSNTLGFKTSVLKFYSKSKNAVGQFPPQSQRRPFSSFPLIFFLLSPEIHQFTPHHPSLNRTYLFNPITTPSFSIAFLHSPSQTNPAFTNALPLASFPSKTSASSLTTCAKHSCSNIHSAKHPIASVMIPWFQCASPSQ